MISAMSAPLQVLCCLLLPLAAGAARFPTSFGPIPTERQLAWHEMESMDSCTSRQQFTDRSGLRG